MRCTIFSDFKINFDHFESISWKIDPNQKSIWKIRPSKIDLPNWLIFSTLPILKIVFVNQGMHVTRQEAKARLFEFELNPNFEGKKLSNRPDTTYSKKTKLEFTSSYKTENGKYCQLPPIRPVFRESWWILNVVSRQNGRLVVDRCREYPKTRNKPRKRATFVAGSYWLASSCGKLPQLRIFSCDALRSAIRKIARNYNESPITAEMKNASGGAPRNWSAMRLNCKFELIKVKK